MLLRTHCDTISHTLHDTCLCVGGIYSASQRTSYRVGTDIGLNPVASSLRSQTVSPARFLAKDDSQTQGQGAKTPIRSGFAGLKSVRTKVHALYHALLFLLILSTDHLYPMMRALYALNQLLIHVSSSSQLQADRYDALPSFQPPEQNK